MHEGAVAASAVGCTMDGEAVDVGDVAVAERGEVIHRGRTTSSSGVRTTSRAADRIFRATTMVGVRFPRSVSCVSGIWGATRISASQRSSSRDSAAAISGLFGVVALSTRLYPAVVAVG